jgi:hypothetical protein
VDFFARKIRRLRPGSNPRSWVAEASMRTTSAPGVKPSSVAVCLRRCQSRVASTVAVTNTHPTSLRTAESLPAIAADIRTSFHNYTPVAARWFIPQDMSTARQSVAVSLRSHCSYTNQSMTCPKIYYTCCSLGSHVTAQICAIIHNCGLLGWRREVW